MPNSFGGLYQQPNVRLVVDEARSFVRRSKETYDVIIAVRASSRAALVSGALGVAEGYMYTREALEDYFDHLNADGVLLIAFSPLEVARLFATAREVFEARGLGSPARHLVAALVPPDLWGPRHSVVAFLLKKSPWTPAELQMMVERLTFSANGNTAGDILYSPFEADTDSIYHRVLTTRDLSTFYAEMPFNISPATDDRPFFNQRRDGHRFHSPPSRKHDQ